MGPKKSGSKIIVGAKILSISYSDDSSNLTPWASNKEMVISRLLGPKSKNFGHFLSSTFKVGQLWLLLFFVFNLHYISLGKDAGLTARPAELVAHTKRRCCISCTMAHMSLVFWQVLWYPRPEYSIPPVQCKVSSYWGLLHHQWWQGLQGRWEKCCKKSKDMSRNLIRGAQPL